MLRWRLISAAVIVPTLLALVWLDLWQGRTGTRGVWLLPMLIGVSVLATEEVLSLLKARGQRPAEWIVYVGNVMIPLAAGWPVVASLAGWKFFGGNELLAAAVALAFVLVLVGEMLRFEGPGTAVVNAALSTLAVMYVGVLISFWALLRLQGNNATGMTALVSMLLVVKMADVGAFVFGKCIGRNKMTPVLSPGKTWEGTIGGVLTACVTSWVFFRFGSPVHPPVVSVVAYGTLIAVSGMIGDLAESMIKRDAGRKDSSTWLKGLGGVLDIIDATLAAGPVAWVCWATGMMGP